MPSPSRSDVTGLLVAWRGGDAAAFERLVPLVYRELRHLAHARMRGQSPGVTLQTTALVHEAYLRLLNQQHMPWHNRAHFFGVCAQAMRCILVDAARARGSLKRGRGVVRVEFDEGRVGAQAPDVDLLDLDDALNELARVDPRKSRIVELRYFGGLTVEETAEVLHVSAQTVMRDWNLAKLWLLRTLRHAPGEASGEGA